MSGWFSNTAEILIKPSLPRSGPNASARNSCEWNRAATEFEQAHDTRKFDLSAALKLRNARQPVSTQILCSEDFRIEQTCVRPERGMNGRSWPKFWYHATSQIDAQILEG